MIDLCVISAATATELLRDMGLKITPTMLRNGIEQGAFPFGVVIRSNGGFPRCYVFEKRLKEWAEENGKTEKTLGFKKGV